LDVLLETVQGKWETYLVLSGEGERAEAPIERAIVARLGGTSAAPISAVIDGLPWPTPRRKLMEQLLGTNQARSYTEADSFPATIRGKLPSPDALTLGLSVVTAFVKLESCSDIYAIVPPDETEAERRDRSYLDF
jgi:hypothetical protein